MVAQRRWVSELAQLVRDLDLDLDHDPDLDDHDHDDHDPDLDLDPDPDPDPDPDLDPDLDLDLDLDLDHDDHDSWQRRSSDFKSQSRSGEGGRLSECGAPPNSPARSLKSAAPTERQEP